jgi:hypothetical protein
MDSFLRVSLPYFASSVVKVEDSGTPPVSRKEFPWAGISYAIIILRQTIVSVEIWAAGIWFRKSVAPPMM